jgi:glutamate-1-semialdehyde 2,1-aminomutase
VTPGKGTCDFVGTYNGHQVSLAASMAFMEIYEEKHVFNHLQERTAKIITEFDQLVKKHQVKAKIQGRGGHFQWYFTDQEIFDYRDATLTNKEYYTLFSQELFQKGIYCSPKALFHHAISIAHTDDVINQLLIFMDEGLAKLASVKASSKE